MHIWVELFAYLGTADFYINMTSINSNCCSKDTGFVMKIWILNKDGQSWPIMMWIIQSMTTLFSIIPINSSFKMLLNFSLIEPCITNWAIEVAVHLPRWQPPNFCLQTHQPTINNQPTTTPPCLNFAAKLTQFQFLRKTYFILFWPYLGQILLKFNDLGHFSTAKTKGFSKMSKFLKIE